MFALTGDILMKKLLLLLFSTAVFALVCSDSGTNSDDGGDDPGPDTNQTTISITAIGDQSLAESEYVSHDTDEEITVVTEDNVTFRLTIPANALPTSTTITLTPLDTFDLDAPLFIQSIDVGGGTGIRFPGILCDPAGLTFESPATLRIQFPPAQPFPLDTGSTVLYFDEVAQTFFPCSTRVDMVNHRLECLVTHFSGYATANVPSQEGECETLLGVYLGLHAGAEALCGTSSFVAAVIPLLDMKAGNYRDDPYSSGQGWIPCPSFNDQVDYDISQLVAAHWTAIQALIAGDAASDQIDYVRYRREEMIHLGALVYGTDAGAACTNVVNQMLLYISERAHTIAAQGQQMCQQEDCDGQDLLAYVLNLGAAGYVVTAGLESDAVYLAQVQAWYDDCCQSDYTVTLTAPAQTTIYRVAWSPDAYYGDPYSYVCSLNVHVEGASGTPQNDVPVRIFRNDETHHLSSQSTDESGDGGFIVSPGSLDWGCEEYIDWTFRAEAYDADDEEWIAAGGQVSVRFVNVMVTTTIEYDYFFEWNPPGEGASSQAHATLSGTGRSAGRELGVCASSCEGKLTRDYSYENCIYSHEESSYVCYSYTTIGGDSTYPCRAVMDIRSVRMDDGRSIDFVFGASVSLNDYIFAGVITEGGVGSVDTLHYGLPMAVWPEEALVFTADESGELGDTTWTWTAPPEDFTTNTATLTVQVQVE